MAWAILVRIYAKQGQLEQARGVLNEWEKALEERRDEAEAIRVKQLSKIVNTSTAATTALPRDPVEIMEASVVSGIFGDEAKFYEACAHQAAAEGRSLDALTFYQSSLRLMYGGNSAPPDFSEIEAGKAAHGLWNRLNGSNAGWKAWLESTRTRPTIKLPSISRWVAADRQIPDFSLSDQNGEKWTLAALKSKTTLINVWATWCGPCRQELPHLQKLYEQAKDREDIQIITLNIDEDKSLVEPFLKSNNFSFPALFAQPFVEKFAGKIGIPTTWISDKTGTIYAASLYFGMAMSDGSTEHGGYHEALIGLGQVLGPLVGATMQWIHPGALWPAVLGISAIVAVTVVVESVAGMRIAGGMAALANFKRSSIPEIIP